MDDDELWTMMGYELGENGGWGPLWMRIEAGLIALQSSNAVENEKLVGKCEELVVRSNFY